LKDTWDGCSSRCRPFLNLTIKFSLFKPLEYKILANFMPSFERLKGFK
jgi:hypothetical protein